MAEHIGIEPARKVLGDLADRVKYTGVKIVLTKHGKPVADIVPHVPEESEAEDQPSAPK
jgi:prevent-host-death family protein